MKIVITMRTLDHLGGVVSYYKSVLPYIRNEESLDVVCFYLGSRRKSLSLFHPITDQLRFRNFLKKEMPDLVHVNPSLDFKSFVRDGLLIWQSKRKNIPVLVFFRGWNDTFETIVEKRFKWFLEETYLKVDCFIVLASDFREKLRKWGVESDILLGTTAVDNQLVNKFDIDEKINGIRERDKIKILFLSSIEKEKGIFETIDAFALLLNKGYNICLSIAGDGKAFNEATNYARKKEFPINRLNFLGYVSGDDKIKTFKEHDVYCFPTYGEGMPNSVLEAMAFGMPVITRPVGGLKDFFNDGKMGFLANGKTGEEIANLLEILICDKGLLSEISRYNYDFAKSNFMASTVAEKLIKTYKSIL